MAETPLDGFVYLLKSMVNKSLAPTWCVKCGARLEELEVGFREQGSRYACPNAKCGAFALPFAITRPSSPIVSPN